MTAGIWFTQLEAWQVALLGLAYFGGLYLLGGLAMQALTAVLQRARLGQVLDERPLKPGQRALELRQSLVSVLIFGLGLVVPWLVLQLGWARLATDAGAGRIALEIIVLMLWNDVHFWLCHRLLHLRRLVRYHGMHHRSVVTTPWATFSFHPLEAILLGTVILPPMLVHDFSFWSLAAVPPLSLLLNLIGHSNYDFFPQVGDLHPLAASRRHHLHHARPQGNYGFALPVMDQLMGTQVPPPRER